MALRKLTSFSSTSGQYRTATVYRDAEWDEYRVRFYREGVYQEGADYHTDDKQDAMDTASIFCTRVQVVTVIREETGEEIYL